MSHDQKRIVKCIQTLTACTAALNSNAVATQYTHHEYSRMLLNFGACNMHASPPVWE